MFIKGGIAGVRAQPISSQGDLIMSFNIAKENYQINCSMQLHLAQQFYCL